MKENMRHFAKFLLNNHGGYDFEKASGVKVKMLGAFLHQMGYPPDKKFVDWMETLSIDKFYGTDLEIGFFTDKQGKREILEIKSKEGNLSFIIQRNEYVKLFWLWYSTVLEKPKKIIVVWDGKISTVVQIDSTREKTVWGKL